MTLETGLPIKKFLIFGGVALGIIILIAVCCVCIYNYEPFKGNRFGSDVELAQNDEKPEISIKRA